MDLHTIFSCFICFGLIKGNPLGGSKVERRVRETVYQAECCLCNDFDDDPSNHCFEQRCLSDLNDAQRYFTAECEYCQYTKQYTGSRWKSRVQCSIKPLCEHDHLRTIATPGCFGENSPANGTTCYYCCRPSTQFEPVDYCINGTFSGYTKFDRFSHITADKVPPLNPLTSSSTATITTPTTTKIAKTTSTTPSTTITTTTTTTPTTTTTTSTTATPTTTTVTSTLAPQTSPSTTIPTTSTNASQSNKPTQQLAECSVCESFDGKNCNDATAVCNGKCRNRLIYTEAGALIRVSKSCVLDIECTESIRENDMALCSPDVVNRTSSTQFICSYCCDPKSSNSPCNVDMYSRHTTPVTTVNASFSSTGQTKTTFNISSPSTVTPITPYTLNATSDSRSSTLSAGSSNSISTGYAPTVSVGGSNSTSSMLTSYNQTVNPATAGFSLSKLTTKGSSNSSVSKAAVFSLVNTSEPSVSSATNTSSGTVSGAYGSSMSGYSSGSTTTATGSSITRSSSTNTNGTFVSSTTTNLSENKTGPSVSSATHTTSGNASAVFGLLTTNFPFRNGNFSTIQTTSSGKIYSSPTQTLSSGNATRISTYANTSVLSASSVLTSTPSNVKPELTPSPSWHKKLGSTQCMTCLGSMENCDILYAETTCTEPDNYCINFMKNSERGEVTVNRTCGNLNRCYREWFQGSSDNDKCQNYRDGQVITIGFECTYCCIEDLCNEQISPKQSTLYEDK